MKYVLAALVCASLFAPTAGFAGSNNKTYKSPGANATQIQHGHNNLSVVIQHGNNSATTVQNGVGNVAIVIQG